MTKKKLFSEETTTIDNCQCVYCGHIFDGKRACNGNMDCKHVTCTKCAQENDIMISVEYTCVPIEK